MKSLILTCEHGGNEVPEDFYALFKDNHAILQSHQGWDIGALLVANSIHKSLEAPLFYSETSRLLVELNRSLHHPNLFSAYSKDLPSSAKSHILEYIYLPYRNKVEQFIVEKILQNNEVIHISVHSFTPVLNGIVRNTDIGLLYDPSKTSEKRFCSRWKEQIMANSPYKIRYNYPYKGTADGFTTYLRKKFPENYSGIELEINQQLLKNKVATEKIASILTSTLEHSLLL